MGGMKQVLWNYLAVALAGALGAVARFFVSRMFSFSTFPIGTLLINVTGALFLGWFLTVMGERVNAPETLRVGVAVGFVGAYTTFSTYMFESDKMLQDGAWASASAYLAGSLLLGLLAVRLGVIVAHRM